MKWIEHLLVPSSWRRSLTRIAALLSSVISWRAVGECQQEAELREVAKERHHSDDVCGLPEWIAWHMDNESLHEGICGHSSKELYYS